MMTNRRTGLLIDTDAGGGPGGGAGGSSGVHRRAHSPTHNAGAAADGSGSSNTLSHASGPGAGAHHGSPTVVVTPPGSTKDRQHAFPLSAHSHSSHHGQGNGSGAYTPHSHSHSHVERPLSHAHDDDGMLPTPYITSILCTQLVFRALGAAIYMGGLLQWYKYRRYLSLMAYWSYWIPYHYAAMNALRTERGRHVTAYALALLSAALEAFVLISIVYNPEVWGASKLRYLILPTATQGFANLLMILGAMGPLLMYRLRGATRIPLAAITAPALPAADISFFISLLLIPRVEFTRDIPIERVVAVTALLNVCALPIRYMSFVKSFTDIPYLPDHTVFASITLNDAWQKGKELSRKMSVLIPGLPDDEPHQRGHEDEFGFIQQVYILHFVRLAVALCAWDLALAKTSITDTVARHPWLALLGAAAIYKAPAFLARMRGRGPLVTGPAVIAVDVIKGLTLASASGLLRWFMNVFRVGVSSGQKDHIEAHAQLIVLIGILVLLGTRGARALTFFTSSVRMRSVRGAIVALALIGNAMSYMGERYHLWVSLRGLLPYWSNHDEGARFSAVVLFLMLAAGLAYTAYVCVLAVWTSNVRDCVVARLPAGEVLLGTLVLSGGEEQYDVLRRTQHALSLPQLTAAVDAKHNVFSAV